MFTRVKQRADFQAVINDPARDRLALRAVQEFIALMKNNYKLLPHRNAKAHWVLRVGLLAEAVNLGGCSTGTPKFYVDAVAGIRSDLDPEASVEYSPGCTMLGGIDEQIKDAVDAASGADVVIAVVGQMRAQVREIDDRDSLDLPCVQERLVEAMRATGKPLIVVPNNGLPFALSWILEHVPAVIESRYGGQSYGTASAQAILGEVNRSCKLGISFPVSMGQSPSYNNHLVLTSLILYSPPTSKLPYPLGKAKVLWPFGHGLNYSTFRYDNLRFSTKSITSKEIYYVSFTIANASSRAGDEAVRLIVHQDYTSLKRPIEHYGRLQMDHAESRRRRSVTFPVGFDEVKFRKDGTWQMGVGSLSVMIGVSSHGIRPHGASS